MKADGQGSPVASRRNRLLFLTRGTNWSTDPIAIELKSLNYFQEQDNGLPKSSQYRQSKERHAEIPNIIPLKYMDIKLFAITRLKKKILSQQFKSM